MLQYHRTSTGGSVYRSNQWGNGGSLEVTVYFNTAHISVMLQAKDMCDIITTIHELFSTGEGHFKFGHFGLAILGNILPMLAFWIVTTDNGTNQHQQEVEHVWL